MHNLKGLSTFSIYGRNVYNADYTPIAPGILEKLLRFTHAGPLASIMRCKSVLPLVEGWTIDLPAKVYEILNERTGPTWSTLWFGPLLTGEEPLTDFYSVRSNGGANHCTLGYGLIGADLITLASVLNIPVCKYNIQKASIFCPSAWSAFGTKEPQGADFRACANYRPLYLMYEARRIIFVSSQ